MLAQEIQNFAHPMEDEYELDWLINRMSRSRIVMLGEATHGTEDFYRIRRIISQRLIERHGFRFIAVEGDWPDCFRLNRYIKTGEGGNARAVMQMFHRWPTWMWANMETEKLIEWMHSRGAGFYGLDVYSLFESLDILRDYAARVEPSVSEKIMQAYDCFDPHGRSELSYARALSADAKGCEEEVVRVLLELARTRFSTTRMSEEELFDARQNAFVVKNGEQYCRKMLSGEVDSWNVRDRHMLDTLDMLLQFHTKQSGGDGDGVKGIVWAHNTHIGDYHATDMLDEGYINLGGIARERYGIENVFLLGFGTFEGEVLAGSAWSAPPKIMPVPSAPAETYENIFHEVAQRRGVNEFFLDLSAHEKLAGLNEKRGHRAIGVVYNPGYESRRSNYVPTSLAQRYDAFVFVDKTKALRPIAPPRRERGMLPETYPSGV